MWRTMLTALAVMSVLAGTATASNPAYWSARYGGWSKEVDCWNDGSDDMRHCQVITVGKYTQGQEWAWLHYACTEDAREWLYFGITYDGVTGFDVPAIEVSWDGGSKEDLPIKWTIEKPKHYLDIQNTHAFVEKMAEHDEFTAWIPFLKHQRPDRMRFGLANAIRAMKAAAGECGIRTSEISPLINP